MIFAADRKTVRTGKREAMRQEERRAQEKGSRMEDLCRQRLLEYAESFRELARSFYGECPLLQEDRQVLLERHKIWENRQLISQNLNEVAKIITSIAENEIGYLPIEERRRRVVVHALRAEGIIAENICYLPNEKGLLTLGMSMRTERRGSALTEEAAGMLSMLWHSRLKSSAGNPLQIDRLSRNFIFVEEPRFQVLTGFARVTKEKETVSGDNYSIVESELGRLSILLSDGTGSGEQANKDSGEVLDLMEKMLETGFTMETAADMVNTAVFAKGEEWNHPTLDICNLDLHRGTYDICKIGGAATFLKRDQEVDKIESDSLPLGIFQKLQVETVHNELYDGDYFILMTDGAVDAMEENGCEGLLEEAIRSLTERNPKQMAEKLMQRILCKCGGHIRDDMTILVAGVWENERNT